MTTLIYLDRCPDDDAVFVAFVAAAIRRFSAPGGTEFVLHVGAEAIARTRALFPKLSVVTTSDPIVGRSDDVIVHFESGIVDTRIDELSGSRVLITTAPEFPDENVLFTALKRAHGRISDKAMALIEPLIRETGKTLRALVIPGSHAGRLPDGFERLFGQVRNYMASIGVAELAIAAAQETFGACTAAAGDISVRPLGEALSDPSYDHWIFLGPYVQGDSFAADIFPDVGSDWIGKRVFVCTPNGRIRSVRFRPGETSEVVLYLRYCERLEATVFHRFANHDHRPRPFVIPQLWFEYDDDGHGKRDIFGHRIDVDMKELEGRPEHHKVVCMYGGSSVNSIYCLQHETASAVLERALNEHAAQKQLGLQVTVLNFGLPSSSVLQNMHSYLMFQPIVRPDIVVCLDGYNDLYNGVRGDRILLNKYYVAYSGYIEPWSRRGALVEPPNKVPIEYNVDTGTTSRLGNPRASVRSYLERKRQFMTMVEGMGGRFVWALQPIDLRDTIKEVMVLMLDLLYARFEPPPVSIDLHQEFLQRPDRDKIFESVAHMSPYGESLIGARLADIIIGNGLLESR